MSPKTNRRELLQWAAIGMAAGGLSGREILFGSSGGIRQSVCRWCYSEVPLPELARAAKKIGYSSVELLGPEEFLEIKPLGLTCAMLRGTGPIEDCLNRPRNHERCLRELRTAIDFASAQKIPSVICFSGNRDGMDDEVGLENCATALRQIAPYAEEAGVTVCLELLNSRVNHPDYMADHTEWGVRLIQRVDSPWVKLLYDIYHMQIMEGDIIRRIRENYPYIGHYHTGGVPGRHEIDETQELNYPAIVRAIQETGYQGYLGQEYIPTREPLESLAQGFEICRL